MALQKVLQAKLKSCLVVCIGVMNIAVINVFNFLVSTLVVGHDSLKDDIDNDDLKSKKKKGWLD